MPQVRHELDCTPHFFFSYEVGVCVLARERNVLMQSISEEVSNKISNLGILCALLVVLIHTWAPIADVGSCVWWCWNLLSIRGIAVPVFFAISGFLLAGHFEEDGWWWHALRKRVKTLILPCVIWSILWLLYCKGLVIAANIVKHRHLFANVDMSVVDFSLLAGIYPFEHPMLATLWYVRALLIFIIIAPLLKSSLIRFRWKLLFAAFVLWCFNLGWGANHGNWKYFAYDFLGAGWVFFFLLGMAMRTGILIVDVKLKHKVFLWGVGLVVLKPILCVLALDRCWGMQYVVFCADKIMVPTLMLISWQLIPAKKWPRAITDLAFPIYLIHWFVASIFGYLFYGSAESMAQFVIRFSVIVFLSAVIAMAVKRLIPCVSRVLFGGR